MTEEPKITSVPIMSGVVDMELFETVCFERDMAEAELRDALSLLRSMIELADKANALLERDTNETQNPKDSV